MNRRDFIFGTTAVAAIITLPLLLNEKVHTSSEVWTDEQLINAINDGYTLISNKIVHVDKTLNFNKVLNNKKALIKDCEFFFKQVEADTSSYWKIKEFPYAG